MKHYLIFGLILWTFASSCERTGDCMQPAGNWKRLTISTPSFQGVDIHQNIDMQIIPSATQRVEVEYGENLFDQLRFDVAEGRLSIQNLTRCGWAHSYKRPKVYLYTPSLDYLGQFGSGVISNSDTLRSDRLLVEVSDAAGDIHLKVNLNELSISTNGNSNIYLTGKVNFFSINCYWNNGRLYADQLIAKKIQLGDYCYNDLFVNSAAEITGVIESSGNVFYSGSPSQISVKETWTGRLIKQ